eukprot:357537-Chlamydomonas_euryale.AAC.2
MAGTEPSHETEPPPQHPTPTHMPPKPRPPPPPMKRARHPHRATGQLPDKRQHKSAEAGVHVQAHSGAARDGGDVGHMVHDAVREA